MISLSKIFPSSLHLKKTIVQNMSWLFLGELTGRIIKIFLVIYATRLLGTSEWGMFSYILSFVTIFVNLTDIGLNTIVVKELVSNDKNMFSYFSTALYIKLSLLLLSGIIIFTTIPYESIGDNIVIVISLFIFSFFETIRDFIMSLRRAEEKMKHEALFKILSNIIIGFFGFYFLYLANTATNLSIAYGLGAFISFIISGFFLFKKNTAIFSSFSKKLVTPLLSLTWPLAIILITTTVIFNTDILVLQKYRTLTDVGIYSAAQKLVFLFHIIPQVILGATQPAMTKLRLHLEEFKIFYRKVFILLMISSVSTSLITIIFPKQILLLFYGNDFTAGVLPLQILAVSLIPVFINYLSVYTIIVFDKQKKLLIGNSILIVVNIILNTILVQYLGITGAALATTLSLSLVYLYNSRQVKNIIFSYKG